MSDWNIFGTAPESLAGLLGAQATQDLQKKAMTTGLINTALGYLVQPKNQNLGLGRILGQSLMSGMTGAQGVYSGALEDWQTKQKIEELQRKKILQEKVQGYIGNIQDPNERMLAEIDPEQYVAGKVKGVESPFGKVDPSKFTPNSILRFTTTGKYEDLIPITSSESKFKVGDTRSIPRGNQTVTEQYGEDGKWREYATSPKWEPSKPEKPDPWSPRTVTPLSPFSVIAPNGKTYYAPSQAALTALKKEMGI
jgi:hypothetical protein